MEAYKQMDGAGNGERQKLHWSMRPGRLFVFVLAVRCLISAIYTLILCTVSVAVNESGGIWLVFAADYIVAILGLAAGLICYFVVRRIQNKHVLQFDTKWNINVAFWVGLVLLVGFVAIELQSNGLYNFSGVSADFTTMIELVDRSTDMLLFLLLLPVLEERYGLVKSALMAGMIAASANVLSCLISIFYSYFRYGVAPLVEAIFSTSTLLSIIMEFTIGILAVTMYRVASRRAPGAWVLFAALTGIATWLFAVIGKSLTLNQPVNWDLYYFVQMFYYVVIALLGLGVLARYKRWNTFRAFIVDIKHLIQAARGRQDDDIES